MSSQETLWKHAQRTLGEKYFSFLKGITIIPDGQDAVQSDASGNKETAAYAKRREQIRRSQRTHRARTEQYVLGLESEVGRLRLAHADCVALVKSLHQKLSQFAPEYAYEASATAAQGQAPAQIPNHLAAEAAEPAAASRELDSESTSDAQRRRRMTEAMLNPEAGLEFVMTLETPCLPFVQQDLNSQECARSPSSGQPQDAGCVMRKKMAREADPLARIPVGSGAERLLALSSRLDLGEGLITPVQAWDRIKAHARAHLSSPDKIQSIIIEAQSITSCHRHGAALDSQKFEELINRILQ